MSLTLYYNDANPESRSVLLVYRALDIDLKLIEIDDYKGGLENDITNLTPQNSTPVLKDDDLIIWENHAIVTYLINQYRNNDILYPNNIQKRTKIDEILFFDASILLPRVDNIFNSIIIKDEKEISIDKIHSLQEAYSYLEILLDKTEYVAGDTLTVADLCCVASISSATIIIPLSASKYPKLFEWYNKCKKLPYYTEANMKGLGKLDALVEEKMGSVTLRKSS